MLIREKSKRKKKGKKFQNKITEKLYFLWKDS